MRVRDDGLLEVRLHARSPAAVGRDELDLDARAVLARATSSSAQSTVSSLTTSGWFRFVSMRSSIWYAGRPLPVFEMIVTGLPGGELPYRPAALMPMPCCPRDCFRRWNFDP